MRDMSESEVRKLFTEFLGRSELLSRITFKPIKGPDVELSLMTYTGRDDDADNIVSAIVQPRRVEVSTTSRENCINWFIARLEDSARTILKLVGNPKSCHLVLLRQAVIEEDTDEDREQHVYMRIWASFAIVEPGNVEVHEVAAA